MRNFWAVLLAMSICFSGIARSNGELNDKNSENKAKIGFGTYSSLNVYYVSKLSNGLFVSAGKFRFIGLLDISRFDYKEPYSISGGQIQLDYSFLKNKRFNPYIGLNFHHLTASYGGGQFTSPKYNSSDYYSPYYDATSNSINLLIGLEAKIHKGISLVTHLGTGLESFKEVRRLPFSPNEEHSFRFPRNLLASIGLKINVNEFLR